MTSIYNFAVPIEYYFKNVCMDREALRLPSERKGEETHEESVYNHSLTAKEVLLPSYAIGSYLMRNFEAILSQSLARDRLREGWVIQKKKALSKGAG